MAAVSRSLVYDSSWMSLREKITSSHVVNREEDGDSNTTGFRDPTNMHALLDKVPFDEQCNEITVLEAKSNSVIYVSPTEAYLRDRDRNNNNNNNWHQSGDVLGLPVIKMMHKKVEGTACLRCRKTVYPKETVEPRKGIFFHEWCFKCKDCNSKLNLRSFLCSQRNSGDPEVYCRAHAPQLDTARMDHNAKTITDYQHGPKLTAFNNQIRGPQAGKAVNVDASSLSIQSALRAPRANERRTNQNPPSDVIKSETIGLRYL